MRLPDDNYPQKSPHRLLAEGVFFECAEKTSDLGRSWLCGTVSVRHDRGLKEVGRTSRGGLRKSR